MLSIDEHEKSPAVKIDIYKMGDNFNINNNFKLYRSRNSSTILHKILIEKLRVRKD